MKKFVYCLLLVSITAYTSYAQLVTKTIADPGLTYRGSALDPVGDINTDGYPDYIAGAWADDASGNNAGKVYVISGSDQAIIRSILSPTPEAEGWFGYSVASGFDLNADGINDFVVGAPGENGGAAGSGKVHVFSGANGNLLYSILSPTPVVNGRFGNAVLIQNDFDISGVKEIVVGAYQENGLAINASGQVHVFNGNTFRNTIASANAEEFGGFGWRVATADNFLTKPSLIVSAIFENPGASEANSGAIYAFDMTNSGSPLLTMKQASTPTTFGNFGWSVTSYLDPVSGLSELLIIDGNGVLGVIHTNGTYGLIKSSGGNGIIAGKFDRNNVPDFATFSETIFDGGSYKNVNGIPFGGSGYYVYEQGFGDAIMNLGDVDNDGANEIVAFSSSSVTAMDLKQLNSNLATAPNGFARLDFTLASVPIPYPNPVAVSLGDLDGDGKIDLAAADNNSNSVSVLRNTSTGSGTISFDTKVDFVGGINPQSISLGDLDNDGKTDMAVGNGEATLSVFRNTSTGPGNISYASKIDFSTNGYTPSIALNDLDGDSKIDLISVSPVSAVVSVFRNTGSGPGDINYAPKTDFATAGFSQSVYVADFDGDGKKDIAVVSTGFVSILLNTSPGAGTISYATKVDFVASVNANYISAGDVDADGKIDLVVTNGNDNTVSIFLNASPGAGTISYATKVDFPAGPYPNSVAIGNLDTDNKADLAITNANGSSLSVLRNTSTGIGLVNFAAKEDYTSAASPRSVNIGDLDSNGVKDVALAGTNSQSISVFRNLTLASPPTISSFTPAFGYKGTPVTITGTNFDPVPSNNIIKFNGTVATVTASTSTTITTKVPAFATTGTITVTIGSSSVTSATSFTVAQSSSVSDSLALVALYNSTNGANWTDKTNWLIGPLSTWHGVTVINGRVDQINLTNNLVGTIPPEIGNLTAIRFLRLYSNSLTGNIPNEIGNLTALKTLGLAHNKLSGTIPAGLWDLTTLGNIFISDNQLTGTIPPAIGNLTNLFQLILSDNQLTGSLPTEISNLNGPGLTIYVDHNQLSGTIPASIGNMPALTGLYLNNNNFSGAIPTSFANLSQLQGLSITNNSFTDFPNLSALTTLTSLNLDNNLFTFEDIAPNVGISGITYSPQKKLTASSISLQIGQPVTFTKIVGGTGNIYQWKKGATNITGATTNTYSIGAVSPSDNAGYNLNVTNPSVPGLTIQTEDFILTIASAFVAEESGYQFYKAIGAQAQGVVQVSTGRDVAFDSNGNLLILDSNELTIKKFDAGGNLINSIGRQGTNDGRFTIVMSIALTASDNIYVVDFSLSRVQLFNSSGQFVTKWGSIGTATGQFRSPRGIAVDNSTGNVYVADTGNNRIQVFNSSGVFQFSFGTVGSGNGQLNQPYKILVTPAGQVLVADRGNNRVQVFTLAGVYFSQFGSVGSGDGQFNGVNEMAVDTNGDILVCDQGNSRIQRFNSAGLFLNKFGVNGINPGEFRGLESIAIASNGDIVAGDINNGVQRYTNAGTYLSSVGNVGNSPGLLRSVVSIAVDSKGNRYLAEQNGARIQKFDKNGNSILTFGSYGSGNGQFTFVQAVAVDRNDNVYVADGTQNRIQKFTSLGTYILSFGSTGTGDGQLSFPVAMVFDKANTLWVLENGNKRVQQFTTSGVFTSKFGTAGTGVGQLNSPQGIAIDPSGNLFISENNPNRIQSFKKDGTYLSGITTSAGNAPGQFNLVFGISFDFLGKLYLSDRTNNRIQKMENDFSYLTKFGESGTGNGDFFNGPNFVHSNTGGDTLWISEFTNRVQIWTGKYKQVNATDSLALVSFYDSLGGANWTNKTNWKIGPINTWYGVGISAGRVRSLNLKSNNLQGKIPSSIGGLAQLISLDLKGNKITGLPAEIANLSNLIKIELSNNQLKGPFPTVLSSIPNLASVKTSGNNLTGLVNLPPSTYIVDVRNNKLDGLPSLSGADTLLVQNNKLSFEDLEPNISIPFFSYSPQDSVDIVESQLRQLGDTQSYTASIGGAANVYQWKKNETNLSGATNASLTLSNITFNDDAVYRYDATNTIVTGLTLHSRKKILRVSSLKRDSLALSILFTTTDGPNWLTKTNWLATPLGTGNWFGITIGNNRVTQVNLPSNNLRGPVTSIVADIQNLTSLDLSDNKITALPDLTSYPSISLLNVSKNKLDFASLEKNAAILGINYANQADLGKALDTLIEVGSPANFKAKAGGTSNSYQWKRNGQVVSNATDTVYTITSIARSNMGDYVCEVTNSKVPGLLLKTAIQRAQAVASISGKLRVNASDPVTKGKMTLLKINPLGTPYTNVRNVAVNADGSYTMEKIVLDDYIMLGQADTIAYENYFPTYYQGSVFWEAADPIQLNENRNDIDIIVTGLPVPPKGEGTLKGIFFADTPGGRVADTENRGRVSGASASVRRNQGSGRPTKTMAEKIVAFAYTNENGVFEFDNLEEDTYLLNIQYPGVPMDPASDIAITIGSKAKKQNEQEVVAETVGGKIKVTRSKIVAVSEEEQATIQVYPNPVSTDLHIDLAMGSGDADMIMFDELGREVKKEHLKEGKSIIGLGDVNNGIYILKVYRHGKETCVAKIIK